MLTTGDRVPFFSVETLDGDRVAYRGIWQRRHLLLVGLTDRRTPGAASYARALRDAWPDLTAYETAVVVHDTPLDTLAQAGLADLAAPSVVVADRWGEIHHVAAASADAGLPPPAALVEWLRYVQQQCPECQGENR